jgi:cyclophilin family peptidyl-prolyl cis-trans isomerase
MANQIVVMDTTKGQIKMEIFLDDAPITAGNFLDLVNKGFYNNLSFHRYEPGFVIQGGCPQGKGTGNYKDAASGQTRYIPLEKKPNLKHNKAGVVAMARANDPNSASCQFYITLDKADFLDNPPGYAVFGTVTEGLDVVLKLRAGDKMTSLQVLNPISK